MIQIQKFTSRSTTERATCSLMDALRRSVSRCARRQLTHHHHHHRCCPHAARGGFATSVQQEPDAREHATTIVAQQREREWDATERGAAHRRSVESVAAAVRERMDSDGQQELAESILRSHSFAQEFVKPRMDATFLVDNYTAPALAAAYQDR